MLNTTLQSILLSLVPILVHLTCHEWAHGFIAYKLGDMTAKNAGRLSLNPLKHLDPIGTIMLIFAGFGFAKPVPVNMYNFRNPKRDMALTAIAGPAMNILLAAVASFVLGILSKHSSTNSIGYIICENFIYIGACLAVFNLIPIPPLDGSKILMAFLPNNLYYKYINGSTVTGILLAVLIFARVITVPLTYGANWIVKCLSIFQSIGRLF